MPGKYKYKQSYKSMQSRNFTVGKHTNLTGSFNTRMYLKWVIYTLNVIKKIQRKVKSEILLVLIKFNTNISKIQLLV